MGIFLKTVPRFITQCIVLSGFVVAMLGMCGEGLCVTGSDGDVTPVVVQKYFSFLDEYLHKPEVVFTRSDEQQIDFLGDMEGNRYAMEYRLLNSPTTEPKAGVQKSDAALFVWVRGSASQLYSLMKNVSLALSPAQLMEQRAEWFPILDKTEGSLEKKNSAEVSIGENHTTTFLYALIYIVLFLVFVTQVTKFLLRNSVKYQKIISSVQQNRIAMVAALLLFFVLMSTAGFYALQTLEEKQRQAMSEMLEAMLSSTHKVIANHLNKEQEKAKAFAASPQIISFVGKLQSSRHYDEVGARVGIDAMIPRREYFQGEPDTGFFVIAPNFTALYPLSPLDKVGTRHFLAESDPELLLRVFAGETITVFVSPGVQKQQAKKEGTVPGGSIENNKFFVVTPVIGEEGKVIAAVGIPSMSYNELSLLCESGQISEDGEMYLVSGDGYMLTQSRFEKQLVEAGIFSVGQGQQKIRLGDPGVSIRGHHYNQDSAEKWPLTLMASQIGEKQSTLKIEQYRNYLGNSVVGVWTWDEQLGVGIAIEVGIAGAKGTFSGVVNIVKTSLVICGIMGAFLIIIILFHAEHAGQSLRRARDKWEKIAELRLIDLQEKEEWYALVLASTNDGIWDWNVENDELSFSARYLEIFEYGAEEYADHFSAWMEYVHPDDEQVFKNASLPCLEGHVIKFTAEVRMRHQRGYWVWIQVTGTHVKNEAGEVIRLAGTHADITDKKITAVEIEQRERKFSAIFNQSTNFTAILDTRGCILELNDFAQKFSCQSIGDVAGMPCWQVPWVKNSEGLSDYLQEVIQQVNRGTVVSFERDIVGYENRHIVLDMTFSPIRNEHGGVELLLVFGHDATHARNAEHYLRASEQRFRDMFQNSPVIYYSLNEEGVIADCNDMFTGVLGFSRAEVLGKEMLEFYDAGCRPFFSEQLAHIKKEGVIEGEVVLTHKNGSKVSCILSARVQYDVNGGFLRNHSILVDITERKKAEMYRAQFEAFFDNYPDIAYIRDFEGRFTQVNRYLEKELGCSRDKILGQKVEDFFTAEHCEVYNAHFQEVLEKKKPLIVNSSLVRQSPKKYFRASIFPIFKNNGLVQSVASIIQNRTAEVQRQQEVEALQGRLNAILDNTPSAVFMQDLNGLLLFVNSAWAKYLGVEPSDVIGKKIQDIYPQHESDIWQEIFHKVLAQDHPEVWEITQCFGDKMFVFQNQTFPVRDSDNTLLAIGHICTEVTEQRLAQSELRKAQSILNSIMDNSSAMVFAKDLEGRYTMMNQAFCRFWGMDPLFDIGKYDDDLFAQPVAEKYRQSDLEVIQAATSLSAEDTIENAENGGKRTMLVEKFLIYDEYGNMGGTGGIATDVTPIKKIQEMLKESEERLRFSLASMGTYYWEYNFVEDVRSYDSSEYYSQYGYMLNEAPVSLDEYNQLIYPEDVEVVESRFVAHADKKVELFKAEYRFKAKDGQWFWNHDIGRVVERDEAGNPLKLAGITFDISERKELEAWLTLERVKAEAAVQIKSNFMANMSHEIRTPMNAIIGLCYLLSKTEMSRTQQNYLTKINSSSKSLLNIINDILDFSKIEAGKVDLEEKEFGLEELAQKLYDYFSDLAISKNVTLIIDLKGIVSHELIGDSHRLQQIFANLISNAIKFTNKGKIVVTGSLVEASDELVLLTFTVQDTGIGMAQNEIRKIFDAFSQADDSTTRRFGGTGLGLSITHSLVQMMGGTIEVESVVGEGTVFSFTIGLGVGQKQAKVDNSDCFQIPDFRGLKILIAEDNILNQEVVVGILQETGCETTVVVDGLLALSEMQQGTFDIVLMDVQMYGMDGLESSMRMRAWETEHGQKRLPILALTAGVLPEDREKTLAAGMDGHIDKPIVPKKMFESISKWTGRCATLPVPSKAENFVCLHSLGEIVGMDVSLALKRLGNRSGLLLKMLQHFIVNQSDSMTEMRLALAQGNRGQAVLIAHTLKGVAGTLEAKEVREDAVRLEAALMEGRENLEESILGLEERLSLLVASIKNVLASNNTESQEERDEGRQRQDLQPLLDQLAVFLEQGDPQALHCLNELLEGGLNSQNFPHTEKLKNEVENFSFEGALEILQLS